MTSRRSLIDFAQIVVRPSVHLMDFMKGLGGKGWLFVVAINWLLGAELHSAEVNVETLLTDINRKPAEQRLQALWKARRKKASSTITARSMHLIMMNSQERSTSSTRL